ncbi:MAG: hypothetical protein JWP04_3125 [Belnapia sp.]|jgi:chaperone modulatory protein CbpM|nr:hypothetical protein [Belnapia sp.]
MISLDILYARVEGLDPDDLARWIAAGYVHADTDANADAETPVFQEIDVERLRLILALRDRLDIGEQALPVVLSLLDQVYALRRRLRELGAAG